VVELKSFLSVVADALFGNAGFAAQVNDCIKLLAPTYELRNLVRPHMRGCKTKRKP